MLPPFQRLPRVASGLYHNSRRALAVHHIQFKFVFGLADYQRCSAFPLLQRVLCHAVNIHGRFGPCLALHTARY